MSDKKVKLGNDQENAQSEKSPTPKKTRRERPKLTIW